MYNVAQKKCSSQECATDGALFEPKSDCTEKNTEIYRELIQLDWEVANQEEFFDKMAKKLEDLGYVKDTFADAIKTREANFPTALPVEPYPVAIPHADPQHIIRPFIACTRLKQPIKWCEMANNDEEHDVKFIFMLGFLGGHDDPSGANEHVELLQILVTNFQDPEIMDKLVNAKTEDEYMEAVLSMKGL